MRLAGNAAINSCDGGPEPAPLPNLYLYRFTNWSEVSAAPITDLGGPTVIYPVWRVDRHEPLLALAVILALLAALTFFAVAA
jgi:hypothetical protein